MSSYDWLETIGGPIYVVIDTSVVQRIILGQREWQAYQAEKKCHHDVQSCKQVIDQLQDYFQGRRQAFDVEMKIIGTEFCRQVWTAVAAIPYGQVCSYGEIARKIGKPKAYRAVGLANYKNPLPILIPCHRVIGKNGKMVGYKEFGVTFKEYLLRLEKDF